ncbi:murein biosynthesis integral membrane protein MurJ [Candidatus Saccharibacteria bacterium]|nr:murein biosynthesis integral membrane protein MurJ [Candidatus Saccharibacteria bacterium]MBJ58401.1 murein biosynthesis integral membrane protein MurJ [Candidatus Saccharibacteria bacterium]MBQ68713.1 murein biosynthesis integral membrane protein MurJ [Candidatus Saccharibacteria bacterium]|tara:strand:+ start:197 stop:1834 length:1638 start_codon:yes stop_codon:yes gene_type:complete
MENFRRTLSRLNKKLPLKLAATLLAGSTLLSSLLGLFRDRLFNSMYYLTYPTGADAYTVAFTVPDFMFVILVSGALSVSFIPVFNQRLAKGNKRSAWALSTSIINLMALVTLIASILIIIFAEPLVRYVVGPGLDESSRGLAVSMMRVIAVSPFLFAIATVVTSMQQAVGRFAFFALAPAIYNVGIIIGLLFFTHGINLFGWQLFEGGIMGVALGVVLGAMLQLIVSCLGLYGMGFDYRFKIFWKNKGFRQVLRLLPPRSLDQGIDYVNSIVETNLASRMAAGSVLAYRQVMNLSYVPINLIGVAISTAAFPKMTERIGQGRPDLFKKELQSVLRVIIWLALPVTVVAFFARGYVINFIVNGGDPYMASILAVMSLSILFRSIYFIAARSFYAQQDTKTPLYISFFTIGMNIVLAVWFTLGLDMGVQGLAWAAVITAIVEVAILFSLMSRRIDGLFDAPFVSAVTRMMSAAGFTALISYVMVSLFPLQADDESFFATFPKFVLIAGVSLLSYVLISYLFKLSEAQPVIRRAWKILFGRIPVKSKK